MTQESAQALEPLNGSALAKLDPEERQRLRRRTMLKPMTFRQGVFFFGEWARSIQIAGAFGALIVGLATAMFLPSAAMGAGIYIGFAVIVGMGEVSLLGVGLLTALRSTERDTPEIGAMRQVLDEQVVPESLSGWHVFSRFFPMTLALTLGFALVSSMRLVAVPVVCVLLISAKILSASRDTPMALPAGDEAVEEVTLWEEITTAEMGVAGICLAGAAVFVTASVLSTQGNIPFALALLAFVGIGSAGLVLKRPYDRVQTTRRRVQWRQMLQLTAEGAAQATQQMQGSMAIDAKHAQSLRFKIAAHRAARGAGLFVGTMSVVLLLFAVFGKFFLGILVTVPLSFLLALYLIDIIGDLIQVDTDLEDEVEGMLRMEQLAENRGELQGGLQLHRDGDDDPRRGGLEMRHEAGAVTLHDEADDG